MRYADRDKYGIYQRRSGASSSLGPGPSPMGTGTGGDMGNTAGGTGNLSGTTTPETRGKKNPGDSDI